jgi:hypothetical protein
VIADCRLALRGNTNLKLAIDNWQSNGPTRYRVVVLTSSLTSLDLWGSAGEIKD